MPAGPAGPQPPLRRRPRHPPRVPEAVSCRLRDDPAHHRTTTTARRCRPGRAGAGRLLDRQIPPDAHLPRALPAAGGPAGRCRSFRHLHGDDDAPGDGHWDAALADLNAADPGGVPEFRSGFRVRKLSPAGLLVPPVRGGIEWPPDKPLQADCAAWKMRQKAVKKKAMKGKDGAAAAPAWSRRARS